MIRRDLGDTAGIAESLESIGALALTAQAHERAVHLCVAAQILRERLAFPHSPSEADKHDGTLAAVRAALGDAAFTTEWTHGTSMTTEQAIRYALDETTTNVKPVSTNAHR